MSDADFEETMDEFDAAKQDGVEDEALKSDAIVNNFSITSYGADYTVDTLIKRLRQGAFIIPKFQRGYVWSHTHASKFIESLLMGLPVPGIFLYKQDDNKHLVIDGQQRLRTLEAFYSGVFGEKKFRLVGVNSKWIGKTYDDLEPSDQLKIDDSVVHATIFRQDEPSDALDSVYFVFERINTGGMRLSPQEIRNCIATGPFVDMVAELNKNVEWREIFGGPENKRAKDQELILRFFAMYEDGEGYYRSMTKFLNDYAAKKNKSPATDLSIQAQLFEKTISTVFAAVGPKAFRPSRSLNAAVFDSVMVGLATRLSHDPLPSATDVADAYVKLLNDKKFEDYWVRATADEDSVKQRLKMAKEAFGSI